ncbi:MAG: class F sortase [Ktedonobacteraceae bacterium]
MRLIPNFFICLIVLLLFLLTSCGTSTEATTIQTNKPNEALKLSPTATKAIPTLVISPVITVSAVAPAYLIIPSIGVNAPVENVGIQSNGDLGTPQHNPWEGVGWYSNGPRPGEAGSAVIDGHLDRPGGFPAVFWNLSKVQVGDTIMSVDANGKTLHFRVTRIGSYAPEDAPVQEIFGDTGGTYLNLITCAGTWIPSQKQTTLRLVVYSTLVQ